MLYSMTLIIRTTLAWTNASVFWDQTLVEYYFKRSSNGSFSALLWPFCLIGCIGFADVHGCVPEFVGPFHWIKFPPAGLIGVWFDWGCAFTVILLKREFRSKEAADETFPVLALRCTKFPAIGGCGRPGKPKDCALIWLLLVAVELLPSTDRKKSAVDMSDSVEFFETGEKGEGSAKTKVCI